MSFIPNSFQIANALVDDGMLAKMKGSALALYLIIVRKTRGWNKEMDSISLSQFQRFSGYGKDAVLAGLDRLIELGFIIKISNGQKTSKYMLNDLSEKTTSEESSLSEKTTRLVGKTDKILSEIPTHNNNIKTTNTKTINIYSDEPKKPRSKPQKFSFENELLKLGANKQFVSEFMEVRKAKKAVDSETAFNRFISEQQKSGKSLDEVLETCVVNSWKSFNASWGLQNNKVVQTPTQHHKRGTTSKPTQFSNTKQDNVDRWRSYGEKTEQDDSLITVNSEPKLIGGSYE